MKSGFKNQKICIIGHFGGDKTFNDGQTVKTKEIRDFLIRNGFEVSITDTYYLKKNYFRVFSTIKKCVRDNDVIILIVSSFGYKLISPYIIRFNKKANKKLFDFVIGGRRYKIFDKNFILRKVANKFTRIYVETKTMKLEYNKRGISNVEIIPNFKNLKRFSIKVGYSKNGELHTCIFSRIIEEKGISDAINAIKIANESDDKCRYYLDIYGRIDSRYKEEFEILLENNCKYVSYIGEIDPSKSSVTIKDYDVLLFPTYWVGEGFPGTLIDAFFAAIPIVATDWNDNFEILEDKKNALKVNVKSPNEIAEAMKKMVYDKKMFKSMSKLNYNKADDYVPERVMRPFLNELEVKNER